MKKNVKICKYSWTLGCCLPQQCEELGSSGVVHGNYKMNHA